MSSVRFDIDNNFTSATPQGQHWGILRAIYDSLSYQVEGVEFINRHTGGDWDGVASFFDKSSGNFYTGFAPRVLQTLKRLGFDFEVHNIRTAPEVANPDDFDFKLADPSKGEIELRDYQQRTVTAVAECVRGMAKIATGGGKTESAVCAVNNFGLNTIFLVHRRTLMHQTYERFCKRLPHLKGQIGMVGDGIFDPKKITVAVVDSMNNFLATKREKTHKKDGKPRVRPLPFDVEKHRRIVRLCEDCEFLIVDEAHLATSEKFLRVIESCKFAYYRLGLTATPYLRSHQKDNMMVEGLLGPILTEVTAAELIERGILAKPFFKFIEIDQPKNIKSKRGMDEIYDRGIVNNEFRNAKIVESAKELRDMKCKTLVIVSLREHGKLLEELLEKEGVSSVYLDGDNTTTERKEGIEGLQSGKYECIIATSIFDEGIDVEELNALILAAGNKSAPALFQRTGRAMRKKDEDNWCIVIDFIDNTNKKLKEHSTARYDLVANEPGFTILQ